MQELKRRQFFKFKRTTPTAKRTPWTLLQRSGIALLTAALVTFGVASFSDLATAAVTQGSIVPGSLVTVGTVTTGTPFSSGQGINVVIPANSVFQGVAATQNVQILECSAPGGVPPLSDASCDGNTLDVDSFAPNADGSINYQSQNGGDLFPVYALPDNPTFGESSGTTCGNTSATECILFIGSDRSNFSLAHVWSQPFFVQPNADDLGEKPGDGSPPPVPAQPSATLSTVDASPTTVTADGADVSTVTVTLLGAGSVPVSGKTVALTTTPSTTTKVVDPVSTTSDSNGQVVFTVTDSADETVTLNSTDTTDGVTLTPSPPATVTFSPPVLLQNHSTVIASPTLVASGAMTTITVTLRDQGTIAQPLANQTVTLSQNKSAVIVSATSPNVTNTAGIATFTATDATAEQVTFTATDVTAGNTILTSTATVTFGTLTVDPGVSTLTAVSPAKVNGAGTQAVVTLLTTGKSPIVGKTVSLTASSATATVVNPSSTVSNSQGQVTFTVTDTTAESVTLTAVDTTDPIALTQTATVQFQTPATSASLSTILGTTTSPADGQTQDGIKVTINDQFGDPLAGKVVSLSPSPSGNVQFRPTGAQATGGTATETTDSSGVAEFEADDSTAEVVTFTATDTTDNVVLTRTAVLTFTAGPADADTSTVVATPNPPDVPADGKTPATITVTLTDLFGNPIPGKTIALAPLNGSSAVTIVSATTSSAGVASFTATDATAEFVTYQATDTTDSSLVLTAQAVVTFGSPPSPPPVPADCSVVANPPSVPADGTSPATITVLLYDGSGDAVVGKILTLTPSGGNSKVTTVSGTTDNTGSAVFTVSDATAESVTYTVTDTTDNVVLTGETPKVTFTATSGAVTTTTTSTTTTTIPGTTTTTSPSSGATTTTSTTTTVPAPATASDSGSGTSSSTGSSGSSLAFTGASVFLPWLAGFGVLLLIAGTLGRRRVSITTS